MLLGNSREGLACHCCDLLGGPPDHDPALPEPRLGWQEEPEGCRNGSRGLCEGFRPSRCRMDGTPIARRNRPRPEMFLLAVSSCARGGAASTPTWYSSARRSGRGARSELGIAHFEEPLPQYDYQGSGSGRRAGRASRPASRAPRWQFRDSAKIATGHLQPDIVMAGGITGFAASTTSPRPLTTTKPHCPSPACRTGGLHCNQLRQRVRPTSTSSGPGRTRPVPRALR